MKARARGAVPAVPAPPVSPPARADEPWAKWGALASALATIALYVPALRYGWVWDDLRLVSLNPMLRSWPGVLKALRSDFWVSTGNDASGLWRPFITASYAWDGALFRWQPWGFHLANVLVAAAVSALVTLVAVEFGAGALAATLAGLWFAAMPHHVESIAWIAGRTDVHAAAMFLLALWLDRRADARGARSPGVAPMLALAFALLAKEACAPFAAVAFLAHAADGRRRPWREALRWVAPYLVLTAAYLVAHVLLVRTPPPPAYLGSEMIRRGQYSTWLMLAGYLRVLWPAAPHTPATILRLPESALDPGVVGGIALQAALLTGLVVLAVRRSRFAAPLALFWLTLLPTFAANLFQAYLLFSERFMYLPSAGVAWLAALRLAPLARRGAARAGVVALALAWTAWCAVVTLRTLPDWRSEETLYRSMTVKGPRNAQGWILLSRLYLTQGREAEAEQALRSVESLAAARPEAYSVRALIHYRHGDWPRVLEYAEKSLALDPTLIEPRLARATALLRTGRAAAAAEAIEALHRAIPDNPTVLGLQGQQFLAMRRPADALPYLERATRWLHDDADLYYALGAAYAMQNQLPPAREAFANAVRIEPSLYDGWLKLATACHLLGDTAGRDAALARARALPESADGRAAALAARLVATSR